MTEEKTEEKPKATRGRPKGSRGRPRMGDSPRPDPTPIQRTVDQSRLALRRKVRNFYDLQRIRLIVQGRLLPKAPGSEIQLTEGDLEILKRRYESVHDEEKDALKDVEDHLMDVGFYKNVILADRQRWKGIGPTMAGVIISEFDIRRQENVSQMWKFAGLAPVPAHRCRTCHGIVVKGRNGWKHALSKCDAVEPVTDVTVLKGSCKCNVCHRKVEKCKETEGYEHKTRICKAGDAMNDDLVYPSGQAMRAVKGQKLAFNKWLKTKLVGVLAPVMLQCGSPYRKHYDEYKHRKISAGWGQSDLHRAQASLRYMIKMLLLDIWREWRQYEGLPIRPSYHEEKQGGHGYGAAMEASKDPLITPEVIAELENVPGDFKPSGRDMLPEIRPAGSDLVNDPALKGGA